MKARRYDNAHVPSVVDIDAYCKSWTDWWKSCQPLWRGDKGWPLPQVSDGTATWGKLCARGKNGLFLVIMSTTWWAHSLKTADQRRFFEEAMDDIRWVIEQQLKAPSLPNMPVANKNIPGTSTSDSNANVPTWLQRGGNKRTAKPSRRLLEAIS